MDTASSSIPIKALDLYGHFLLRRLATHVSTHVPLCLQAFR
jgi:hypothetical protein